MPERLTLAPGVEVPAPEDGSVLRYSGEAVQDVLDFFSLLCFAQNEWAGKPFELLPWEEEAVRQFYGIQVQDEDGLWVRYRRYLYDELPKKNGKTELAAGLGLYHLLYDGEERPRVGVFSSDKENASQIYEAAKYMVENTSLGQPEHDPIAWAVDSRKEIHTKYGGVLKVYSADAATKHGSLQRDYYRRAPRPAQPQAVGRADGRLQRRPAAAGGDRADHGGRRPRPHQHRLGGAREMPPHPGLAAGRARAGGGHGRTGVVPHHVRHRHPDRGRPGADRRAGHL
ncbi:MAG: terminase large subunit domain-containing protein [Flavonifractor plautii]